MGPLISDGGAASKWRSSLGLFLIVLLLASSIPAVASVYDYLYASDTATIRSPPSVTLGAGTRGSPVISGVESNAATVTASAGVPFYLTGSAPEAAPAIDGSATGTSIGGSARLVQQSSKACAGATSCSQPFASNVASGGIVVVSIEWVGTVGSISISDGQSGARCASFTQVSGSPATNTAEAAMWYCTTSTGGAMSPSVSWTTSLNAKLDIYEIAGYTATGIGCATGTGAVASLTTSSSVSFSGSPFLVAAWAISTAKTISAGTGFTLSDTSTAGDGGDGEYSVSGATSPTNFPASRAGGGSGNNWAGVGCMFPPAVSATATATLTTAGSSDVIYVLVGIRNSGSQTVTAVSDTSSLTYSKRTGVNFNTNVRVEAWYAVTTSPLTSDVITVTLSGAIDAVVIAMGVSGTDTASPFDPGLSSPASSSGTGTTASTTLTTSNPNDILIGAVVAQNNPTLTPGSGFTAVTSIGTSTNAVGESVESQSVTAVQSGTSVGYTLGSSQNWVILADAVEAGEPTITADTSATAPGTTGSFTIAGGISAFVWSEAYTSGGTLYAGNWLLDLSASRATAAGTITVSIYVVSSSDAVLSVVLSSGTASVTKAQSEVKTSFAGAAATIPTNGRILVVLTNPVGGNTVTAYWGPGQLTNFEGPVTYNFVLSIVNGVSASWNIHLATTAAQTSNLGRLTNVTIWFTTATPSKQIVVTSGSLFQSSGPTISLPGTSTINIALAAYANATPTASNTPSTVTISLVLASTSSSVYAQYTIKIILN